MTNNASELLMVIAGVGDGDLRGGSRVDGADLPRLTGWARLVVKDAMDLLEADGLVKVHHVSRLDLSDIELTRWGREEAHQRGAPIPSPIEDAATILQVLRDHGEGDRRGWVSSDALQLQQRLAWPLHRVDDAVRVLEDDGLVEVRQFMSRRRFAVSLTALGRAA